MDYIGIIKRAFQITIKNKYLWLFGLLAGAGGGGGSYNFYNGGSGDLSNVANRNFRSPYLQMRNFLTDNWIWIAVIIGIILVIGIILLILSIISQGALVGCINKVDNNKKSGIKDGFKIGKNYFWRVLGLGLLTGIVIFAAVIILGIPIMMLFYYKMIGRGILLVLVALLIFIPLAVVINYMTVFGLRFIVLKNKKVIESLRLAFDLFMKNVWPSIAMSLIMMAVGLVVGMIMIIAFIVVAIPFVILGFIAYFIAQWMGVVIVVILGMLVFFFLSFLLGSIMSTFKSGVWTLAFKELTGIKKA